MSGASMAAGACGGAGGLPAPQRLLFLIPTLLAIAALAAFASIDLPSLGRSLPLCPLHELTGLHCAGCGSTRALHCLLHGRLLDALRFNPLFVSALPFALYLWLCWGAYALFRRRLPLPRLRIRMIVAGICLLVIFGVVRNIPYYPFTLLAPHQGPVSISNATHETEGVTPP